MIEAVKAMSNIDKIRFLQRLEDMGAKYNPTRGSITIVDPTKFLKALHGKR